jgi:hypothetical protein
MPGEDAVGMKSVAKYRNHSFKFHFAQKDARASRPRSVVMQKNGHPIPTANTT